MSHRERGWPQALLLSAMWIGLAAGVFVAIPTFIHLKGGSVEDMREAVYSQTVETVRQLQTASADEAKILDNIKTMKVEVCKDSLTTLDAADLESRKNALSGMIGGSNILATFLQNPQAFQNGAVNSDLLMDTVNPGSWVLPFFWPVVMVLLLIIWPCCCMACCCSACRTCCHKCKGDKQAPSTVYKLGMTAFYGAIGFAIFLSVIIAQSGVGDFASGVSRMQCESFNFIDTLLSGSPSGVTTARWRGALTLLDDFQYFVDLLDASVTCGGSATCFDMGGTQKHFIDSVMYLTEQTSSVEEGLVKITGQLEGIQAFAKQNSRPGLYGTSTGNNMHQFILAGAPGAATTLVDKPIGEAVAQIKTSGGQALQDARAEVRKQLTGQSVTDLKDKAATALDSLKIQKDLFVNSIGSAIAHPQAFEVSDLVVQNSSMGVPALLGCCVVYLLFGAVAIFCSLWRANSTTNPTPCWAGITWCMAYPCALLAFLLCTLLGIAAFVLATVCDVIVNLDATQIANHVQNLGQNVDATVVSQLKTGWSTCIDASGDGSLLTALNFTVLEDAQKQIDAQFVAVDDMGSSMPVVSNQPSVTDLLALLQTPFPALIAYDIDQSAKIATAHPISDAAFAAKAYASSIQCSDQTLPEALKKQMSTAQAAAFSTVTGLTTLITDSSYAAAENGAATTGMTCTDGGVVSLSNAGTCSSTSALPDCVSINSMMRAKQAIRAGVFGCVTVAAPSKLAVPDANGLGYTQPAAAVAACSLAQATANLDTLRTDLNAAITAIDALVPSMVNKISVDLKDFVKTNVLDKMSLVVKELNCKFMGVGWVGVTQAMCYYTIPGFGDVARSLGALGACAVLMIICMYILWWKLKDNQAATQ